MKFTQREVLISFMIMQASRKLSLPDEELTMFRKRALTDIDEHEEGDKDDCHQGESETKTNNNEGEDKEKEKSNVPQMHQAVMDGNVELLKELIKNGADINVLDSTGWPPMHTAIRAGRTECAAILIREGAGEFYYNKQKQDHLKRLERCQKGRKISYWR